MATAPEISTPKKKKKQRRIQSKDSNANEPRRIEFTAESLEKFPLTIDALSECWSEWHAYLSHRTSIKPLGVLLHAEKKSPLEWGVHPCIVDGELKSLIRECEAIVKAQRVGKKSRQVVENWLKDNQKSDGSIVQALAFLAIVPALPWLADKANGEAWCAMVQRVEKEIAEAARLDLNDETLERLLRSIELALTYAYTFREFEACSALIDAAIADAALAMDELVDGEGAFQARDLHRVSGLFAVLTRSWYLAKACGTNLTSGEGSVKLEWLVREVLRWCRPDRTIFLSELGVPVAPLKRAFLESALKLSSDKDDRRIADTALGLQTSKRAINLSTLPEPAARSIWSELAILRGSWHPNDATIAIDSSRSNMNVELFRRDLLWSGTIREALSCDGEDLSAQGDWHELCWHLDDDVCYLEMEKSFGKTASIQRQIILARQDRVLLFADAILASSECELEYRVEIPMAENAQLGTDTDVREISLQCGSRGFRMVPLAAPEWRSQPSPLEVVAEGTCMTMNLKTRARRAYVPLLVDLEPRRSTKALTWRQLTVARERMIEPRDEAVGYRAQIGDEQWLVYRSLAKPFPRTVLGEHLGCEFYFGQFLGDGECVELLSVDSESDDS